MAAGKLFHWKHGWVPVSAQAKAFAAGKGPKPTGVPDKDAGKRQRRVDSLNRTADKRAQMEERYNESRNRKAGVRSTADMLQLFRGNGGFGTPPQSKITDRVQDGRPFLYEPGTGKVSKWSDNTRPDITPGTERTVNGGAARGAASPRLRLPAEKALDGDVQTAVEDIIRTNTFQIQTGAKIGGTPDDSGTYRIGLVRAG